MPERPGGGALARLLEIRRRAEEQRSSELVRARRALSEAHGDLMDLMGVKDRLLASMSEGSGATVGDVQSMRMVAEQVDRGIHNARVLRDAAVAEADARAEAFQDAALDRESIERIVSARLEVARQLRRSTEQKLQDEIALVRFCTGRRNGS